MADNTTGRYRVGQKWRRELRFTHSNDTIWFLKKKLVFVANLAELFAMESFHYHIFGANDAVGAFFPRKHASFLFLSLCSRKNRLIPLEWTRLFGLNETIFVSDLFSSVLRCNSNVWKFIENYLQPNEWYSQTIGSKRWM